MYVSAAENELEYTGAPADERAVDRLCRARDTLAAAGREGELSPTIERIREENRRRPRLMTSSTRPGFGDCANRRGQCPTATIASVMASAMPWWKATRMPGFFGCRLTAWKSRKPTSTCATAM